MSQDELGERVWVLDTSALIEIKDIYSSDSITHEKILKHLESLLNDGCIAFPSQVRDELDRYKGEDDPPAEWARRNLRRQRFSLPGYEVLAEVVHRVPHVENFRKQHEDADPWVVAHALELSRAGYAVALVSEDRIDKPRDTSILTACSILELEFIRTEQFLNHCGALRL